MKLIRGLATASALFQLFIPARAAAVTDVEVTSPDGEIPLSFLGEGSYETSIVRDGVALASVRMESRATRRTESVTIDLPEGGGYLARFPASNECGLSAPSGVAAEAMCRIFMERAGRRVAAKRGAGAANG